MIKYEIKQGSPEWHEFRKSGIGSSDIAKIMGVSRYGTALDVYNEKAGLSSEKETTYAMSRGTYYESIVRDGINEFLDEECKYIPVCGRNRAYPWVIASFDGHSKLGVLEIKIPGESDLQLARDGKIAPDYHMQTQWELFVSEDDHGEFVCARPETDEEYRVTFGRDEALIERMRVESEKFWYNFLNGIPPASTKKDYDIISDDVNLQIEVTQYIEMKRMLAKQETAVEESKQRILSFGNGNSFKAYGITACKTDGRKTYDTDAMRAHGIDVEKYAKFGKETFVVKIDK